MQRRLDRVVMVHLETEACFFSWAPAERRGACGRVQGTRGAGEAGKGDARTGYAAGHCCGQLGLGGTRTPCGTLEMDLSTASVLTSHGCSWGGTSLAFFWLLLVTT